MLGRPEETAAREAHWRGPRCGAAQLAPARASAADKVDPRVSERSRGRRKTTAGLAVGGFSGETNGAYGFASP